MCARGNTRAQPQQHDVAANQRVLHALAALAQGLREVGAADTVPRLVASSLIDILASGAVDAVQQLITPGHIDALARNTLHHV
jgi:hypothetical protein